MAIWIGSSIKELLEEDYEGGFTIGSAMQEDLEEEEKKHEDGNMLHPHWNEDEEKI